MTEVSSLFTFAPTAATNPLSWPGFRLLRARSQGGALLQRALATAGGRLYPEEEDDQALLAVLAYLEELLEDGGVLEPEHACFLAERV